MPYIPHTPTEIREMLDTIGVKSIEQLFDEIPDHLRIEGLQEIPEGLSELEMAQNMRARAVQDKTDLCFIGAGAYEHHIPAAVWDIVSRGEFMTAYTPYQAEASQGTLQLIYEYQTMMASLMGLEVSNASMYDGATALAEAILMAFRVQQKTTSSQRVLIAGALNPLYFQAVKMLVGLQGFEAVQAPVDTKTGRVNFEALETLAKDDFAALVIPQPNFLGVLEAVDELTDWAHQRNRLVIACVNPIAMALLKAPGEWGQTGADIACGEGQPLGVPLASGGPYFGFLTTKQTFVRNMPGRLVGRTVDQEGRQGFTLTLQAREQHIRRAKATSNICTNQGLLVTAATIYMSLLGFDGLKNVAIASHKNLNRLTEKLLAVRKNNPEFASLFSLPFVDAKNSPHFHETILQLSVPVAPVLSALAKQGIQAGFDISQYFPELGNALLICATETKTEADLDRFVKAFTHQLASHKVQKPEKALS